MGRGSRKGERPAEVSPGGPFACAFCHEPGRTARLNSGGVFCGILSSVRDGNRGGAKERRASLPSGGRRPCSAGEEQGTSARGRPAGEPFSFAAALPPQTASACRMCGKGLFAGGEGGRARRLPLTPLRSSAVRSLPGGPAFARSFFLRAMRPCPCGGRLRRDSCCAFRRVLPRGSRLFTKKGGEKSPEGKRSFLRRRRPEGDGRALFSGGCSALQRREGKMGDETLKSCFKLLQAGAFFLCYPFPRRDMPGRRASSHKQRRDIICRTCGREKEKKA